MYLSSSVFGCLCLTQQPEFLFLWGLKPFLQRQSQGHCHWRSEAPSLGMPQRSGSYSRRLYHLDPTEPMFAFPTNSTANACFLQASLSTSDRPPTLRGHCGCCASSPSFLASPPCYLGTPPTPELKVESEGPGGEIQGLSKDLIISKDLC